MPGGETKLVVIPQLFEESLSLTRHYPLPGKISTLPKGHVAGVADDYVVGDFDLEQLARPDQIARHLDIGV